jgi:hypothetical protein
MKTTTLKNKCLQRKAPLVGPSPEKRYVNDAAPTATHPLNATLAKLKLKYIANCNNQTKASVNL